MAQVVSKKQTLFSEQSIDSEPSTGDCTPALKGLADTGNGVAAANDGTSLLSWVTNQILSGTVPP